MSSPREEGNLPLQGVRVTLLGTQLTVTSNPQGRYTIAGIAPGSYRLRASAIGYTPVVVDSVPVRAGQTANADIALKRQTVQLEQVVVVGYGTLAKRDVTGAVGSVAAEQIKQIPTTNAIDAIKGRVRRRRHRLAPATSRVTASASASAARARSRRRTIRSTCSTASRWPAASAT